MLQSANNEMRRFGPRPPRSGAAATRHDTSIPSQSRSLYFACHCRAMRHKSQRRIEHGDVDACKVWECIVEYKDLGRLWTCENLELAHRG